MSELTVRKIKFAVVFLFTLLLAVNIYMFLEYNLKNTHFAANCVLIVGSIIGLKYVKRF